MHLSCSPNFPRASYLDERTLTRPSERKENSTYETSFLFIELLVAASENDKDSDEM